jgi:hypothetical protein
LGSISQQSLDWKTNELFPKQESYNDDVRRMGFQTSARFGACKYKLRKNELSVKEMNHRMDKRKIDHELG